MPDGRTTYEIDLIERSTAPRPAAVRAAEPGDRAALAALMLDAYAGTIDDEGESLADAEAEIADWLEWGGSLADSVVEHELRAACLVSHLDDRVVIGYVMTAAASKRLGLARLVVIAALDGLAEAGLDRVELTITDGNTASERLFAGLGARPLG